MWLDDPADETAIGSPAPARAVIAAAAVGVFVIGLIPTPLLAAARRAAETLL
jgi:NADH:ubiquinone oxidoreductase subunit 2 (subunit N)